MAGKTHRKGPQIIEDIRTFATEEACLGFLEAARWPEGVRCVKCGGDRIAKYVKKGRVNESRLYKILTRRAFQHEIVIHSDKEWVRGKCHTQGIDGFWSLFKRGLVGSYHQVSIKHLQRYLSEFSWRFNRREDEDRSRRS